MAAHVVTIHKTLVAGSTALNGIVTFSFVDVTEVQVARFMDLSLFRFGGYAFVLTFGLVSVIAEHNNFAIFISLFACPGFSKSERNECGESKNRGQHL